MIKMKERRHVKIRTDMYEDIKMKIIDRNPRRDLIHYIWSRTMILAGKVNREGKLYMSKNIPYIIETLAIEFNRECDEVKLALDLLIELEMVELMEEGIYSVKNFVKHQNIKVKEEIKSELKGIIQNGKEIEIGEVSQKENIIREKSEHEIEMAKETLRVQEEEKKKLKEAGKEHNNSEVFEKDTNSVSVGQVTDNNDLSINPNPEGISIPTILQEKKIYQKNNNKTMDKNKEKVFEISDMESQDDEDDIISFYDGEFVLREGETLVREFKVN